MSARYHVNEFNGIGEVIREAIRRGHGADGATVDAHMRGESSSEPQTYFNGYDWSRLESAIANPPADLLATVDAMRERIGEIVAPQRRARRVVSKSESGDELSPIAWAQRDPNGWTEIRAISRPKEIVTVGVNIGVAWNRRPDELLYRGAAAAALCDVLEARGHSVELIAFKATADITTRVDRCFTRVLLKASDQPLDIGSVAFALSEVAFYRLALMSANARRVPGKLTKSWGKVAPLTAEERAGIDIVAECDILTEERAIDWIREHAKHANGDT